MTIWQKTEKACDRCQGTGSFTHIPRNQSRGATVLACIECRGTGKVETLRPMGGPRHR